MSLPAMRAAVLGQSLTRYLALDRFTTAASAPLASPRAGEIDAQVRITSDNRFTIVDSGNKLSITNGRLVVGGGSASWNDPKVVLPSIARASVGAVVGLVRFHVSSDVGPALGWAASATPADPTTGVFGVYHDATATKQFYVAGPKLKASRNNYARSIDYLVAQVVRPGGGYWTLISGGEFGAWPNATVVWVDDAEATDPLVPILTWNAGQSLVDQFAVLPPALLPTTMTTRYGLAWAADTFQRADGALNGSTTEVGSLVWAGSGTINIASHVVAPSASSYALVNLGGALRVIEAEITTPASGNIEVQIPFRSDSTKTNYLLAYFTQAIVNLSVIGSGARTIYNTGAFHLLNGKTYRIRVHDTGSKLAFFYKNVTDGGAWTDLQSGGVVAASENVGQFYTGIFRGVSDTGTTWSVFAAYPATVALPAAFGPFPSPPAATGAATITDTFTGTDATVLSTYDPSWSKVSGQDAEINTNKARLTAASKAGLWVREGSLVDVAVSCDITVPSTLPTYPIDWNPTILLRYTDANNYVYGRYLHQGANGADAAGSPEVEVWEVVAGVAALVAAANIGDVGLAASSTHTLLLAVKGQNVAAYHDGTLVAQGVTRVVGGTKVGLGVSGVDATSSGQPTFDNFTVKAAA